MKQIFKTILSVLSVFIFGFLLSGCTFHKYKLVGVVFQDNPTKVVLIEDIKDETVLNYLKSSYGNDCYIDLNENKTFTMAYSLADRGVTITFSRGGNYEIEKDTGIITFNFVDENNKVIESLNQQYTGEKIIFYDNEYYLVFK